MLIIAQKLHQLSFGSLMEVYLEGNREKAQDEYFDLPEYVGLQQAEQDFYSYLKDCFFKTPQARYAVLSENGHYVSALRWEPYSDGVLISALETAPDRRGMGYGSALLRKVLELLDGPVYSHVGKKNAASLRVHEKCGFEIISNQAKYIDGSVNSRCYTLLKKQTGCRSISDTQV